MKKEDFQAILASLDISDLNRLPLLNCDDKWSGVWSMHPKALGRAKVALRQLSVLKEMSLSLERGVLLPPRGAAVPSPDCLLMPPPRTVTEQPMAALPGSTNHRFYLASASHCRMSSMLLPESLQQHDTYIMFMRPDYLNPKIFIKWNLHRV